VGVTFAGVLTELKIEKRRGDGKPPMLVDSVKRVDVPEPVIDVSVVPVVRLFLLDERAGGAWDADQLPIREARKNIEPSAGSPLLFSFPTRGTSARIQRRC
jgi:hypothetical protein